MPIDASKFCGECGARLPELALACGECGSLVYQERLRELATEAKQQEAAGNFTAARQTWRQALILLPPDAEQARTIEQHLADFDVREAGHAERQQHDEKKAGFLNRFTGPLAMVGFALWKFKSVALLFWGKAKFLLLGLGKAKTALSMLASIWIYLIWFGWKFAAGFILGIYIHEMGHVWRMQRYGMQPTGPMFIPMFGAFVAAEKAAANAHQAARVGLAGPVWGLGSAVVCAAMAIATEQPIWRALAQSLAFINLFNLLPVWIFDGHFAFAVLNKTQRLMIGGVALVMLIATGVGMNLFLLMGIWYKVFIAKDNAEKPDWRVAIEFMGLVVALSVLASIPAEHIDRL